MAVWKIQAAFFYGEKKWKEHRFVAITDEYVQYLQKAEPHVMSNKIDERTYHRKYVGIVEKLIGKGGKKEPLTKKELPYTIAMVILDIVAPILLMLGIARTNSANVSLLNNFEIVADKLSC